MQESPVSSSIQNDSNVFAPLNKTRFPFAENPETPVKTDSAKVDQRKKFIESQIKTKVIEPIKKKLLDGFAAHKPVPKDTALLSIQLSDSTAQFRFKDIVARPNEKIEKEAVAPLVVKHNFFSGHLLKPLHSESQSLNRDTSLWTFFVLFFMVVAFAWIRVFYTRTIRQIFQALLNITVANQMVRDENLLLQRASVFLTVLFNLVAAFFLYETSVLFEWSSDYIGTGFGRFIIFALLISFMYSFKFIFLRITAFIFNTEKPVSGYIFNIFLINNVLGMVLLPSVIGIAFLPDVYSRILVKIAIALVLLGFLYRLMRGLLIGLTYAEFSKFYLLLYLCTLEIVPLIIMIRLCVS